MKRVKRGPRIQVPFGVLLRVPGSAVGGGVAYVYGAGAAVAALRGARDRCRPADRAGWSEQVRRARHARALRRIAASMKGGAR